MKKIFTLENKASLARIYLSERLALNSNIELSPEDFQHLITVLRLKLGYNLLVFNEKDGEFLAEIIEIARHSARVRVVEKFSEPKKSEQLVFAFPLIKSHNLHFIIEKATELGVTDLLPVVSERTIHQHQNLVKLAKIAKGATEQCERYDVPEIHQATDLASLVTNWQQNPLTKDKKLFYGKAREGKQVQAIAFSQPHIWLIGPEGGFSPSEEELLATAAFSLGVNFGSNILRAETAAIFALSITKFNHQV